MTRTATVPKTQATDSRLALSQFIAEKQSIEVQMDRVQQTLAPFREAEKARDLAASSLAKFKATEDAAILAFATGETNDAPIADIGTRGELEATLATSTATVDALRAATDPALKMMAALSGRMQQALRDIEIAKGAVLIEEAGAIVSRFETIARGLRNHWSDTLQAINFVTAHARKVGRHDTPSMDLEYLQSVLGAAESLNARVNDALASIAYAPARFADHGQWPDFADALSTNAFAEMQES